MRREVGLLSWSTAALNPEPPPAVWMGVLSHTLLA